MASSYVKVPIITGTGPAAGVDSFNGREGVVVSADTDYPADIISYDNGVSSLTATEVQAALDEIVVVTDSLNAEKAELATPNSAVDSTDSILFTTGNITANVAGISGALSLVSGNTSSTDADAGTGQILIKTGNKTGAGPGDNELSSGAITVSTGTTKTTFSGNVQVSTGASEYQSGDLLITTGAGLIPVDGWSGFLQLQTGNVSGLGAECGDIELTPGSNGDDPALSGRVILNSLTRLYTAAADPLGPIEGDVYFNTVTNKIKVYNGSGWETVTSA